MPQKMLDVPPETFLQGVDGVGQYSYDELLQGLALGWLGASDSDILMGLSGLGRLSQAPNGQPKSVMDAIIKNAAEMNAKTAAVDVARKQAAANSPVFAVALAKKAQQTSMPGANEAKGVKDALNAAAKKAVAAKKEEQAAKVLLAQSDKRGAAAKAVNAMTLAREAAIMANKAEKTRIARSLDILSNTLKAQADYIDSIVQLQVRRSGANAQTMAMSATAQSLREQIRKLKAASGTVAALPTIPPQAPTQQRIADLANKFNIRTAAENKFDAQRAVISVLSDLAENPMSQVKDYAGALTYYGVDGPGRVMADMEFGNFPAAMAGISGMVHGVGYFETTQVMAQADDIANAAHKVAEQTYAQVVLPAAGLGGLGALGDMASDHGWCDRNNSNAKQGGFPAGELQKCKKCPVPAPPFTTKNDFGYFQKPFGNTFECLSPGPESPVGRQARGMTVNWDKVVEGWTKPPAPPPAAAPPPQVPAPNAASGGAAITTPSVGSSLPFMPSVTMPAKSNTMMYVGIGVGVLALGGAAYYFTRK